MIFSSKFDLFETQYDLTSTASDLSMDPSIFNIEPAESFQLDFTELVSTPVNTSGPATAFGSGTASASFSGFASGSGTSSISVSASAYVAPDGSSGSSISASASGDIVFGTGTAQAGTDFDTFTFDVPELEMAPLSFDLDPIDYDTSFEIVGTDLLDLSIWL